MFFSIHGARGTHTKTRKHTSKKEGGDGGVYVQ
jgi:hypothetical protein